MSLIFSLPPSAVNGELSQDDQVIKATTHYIVDNKWAVLPFDRVKGYCSLEFALQNAFFCGAAEVANKFSGQDVGIIVDKSGLVDLDVDCPEAVPFIEWLLPATATISRKGKLVSHLLFESPPTAKSMANMLFDKGGRSSTLHSRTWTEKKCWRCCRRLGWLCRRHFTGRPTSL